MPDIILKGLVINTFEGKKKSVLASVFLSSDTHAKLKLLWEVDYKLSLHLHSSPFLGAVKIHSNSSNF